MAQLVPCLVGLRAEFDTIAPGRDKSSDGWIGDPAHAARDSDHNPDPNGNVHAIDVDEDLRRDGLSMEDCLQTLLARCRRASSDPQNEPRLTYLIYERRIFEAPDWHEREYTGDNPHDKHLHASCEYAAEYADDTSPWGLVDKYGDDLPMDQASFNKLLLNALNTTDIAERAKVLAGQGVHNQKLGASGETIGQDLQGDDNAEILSAIAALSAKVDALPGA